MGTKRLDHLRYYHSSNILEYAQWLGCTSEVIIYTYVVEFCCSDLYLSLEMHFSGQKFRYLSRTRNYSMGQHLPLMAQVTVTFFITFSKSMKLQPFWKLQLQRQFVTLATSVFFLLWTTCLRITHLKKKKKIPFTKDGLKYKSAGI